MPSFPTTHLGFPPAQQAQIIRANQRDLFHVSSLREQTDTVLRSWLGTRRLTRWDKEVDAFVKLLYYGLTIGRATQTLGEEYTDIWQYSSKRGKLPPSTRRRALLIILSVFPAYALAKLGSNMSLNQMYPELGTWLRRIQKTLSITTEVNLALFYLRGTYYDPIKRILGIQQLSSFPENPHTRPPSYSLLGVMIGIRLVYRLVQELKPSLWPNSTVTQANDDSTSGSMNAFLDDRPISQVIKSQSLEDAPVVPAEDDEGTALDVASISEDPSPVQELHPVLGGKDG
ncbi:peroxisome assembly protein per8 [Ephemerocybe angulata]|uniref:RING-type E3 ubiquitin transferase n=1 Tax=Ephemerocybe angulata TaxID=980116 RepID=A0A8H6IKP5_9AGAR|nr:peroxisome assembly protein per8 [Tulosesus angulatus]